MSDGTDWRWPDGGTPVSLDHDSPIPLFRQIEADLRERIESRRLAANARIPSEVELAGIFGVSRMTARRAVDELTATGLVLRRPRSGTFVAPARISHPLSTSVSLSHAVLDLELELETRVLIAALIAAPDDVANELRVLPGDPVVMIQRVRSVHAEPYAQHTTYLDRRHAAILQRDLRGSLTEAMRLERIENVGSRDSVEARLATMVDAEALGIHEGEAVLHVEGRGYDARGAVVRFTRSLYRGDRFRFSMDGSVAGELRLRLADDDHGG